MTKRAERRSLTACPVCEASLEITELTCTECRTRLAGRFSATALARVAPEHQAFIETFVLCRGVIRDVERALGISYPTVRARLDAAVEALEAALRHEANDDTAAEQRRTLLTQVESGLLSPEEAAERLRHL
ncbi:MAG: DUF2089 family protein [Capsulimonadales bacterium]|nr:DUF2089 family protein [Capsulimonadales bacterium]